MFGEYILLLMPTCYISRVLRILSHVTVKLNEYLSESMRPFSPTSMNFGLGYVFSAELTMDKNTSEPVQTSSVCSHIYQYSTVWPLATPTLIML